MIETITCLLLKCDACGYQIEHDWTPHYATPEAAREEWRDHDGWTDGTVDICGGVCRLKPHVFVEPKDGTDDCPRCAIERAEHETPAAPCGETGETQ